MSYLYSGSEFSGIMQKLPLPTPLQNVVDTIRGKDNDQSPPPPPPPEMTEVPEDPADYLQDPACPEGKRRQGGSQDCTDDPIYIELMMRLNQELRDLEQQEAKVAQEAKMAEAQEQLRIENEQRRIAMDEQRRVQRIEEEAQVKRFAVLGLGGLGALTIITLIVKLILR